MAEAAKNDWEDLIKKPDNPGQKKFQDEDPDLFKAKREDCYYTMYPSDAGEKYAFSIIRATDGTPAMLADFATIKRHRFTSPKDGQHYFEKLKMPMDPSIIFNMEVLNKKTAGDQLTEAEEKELANIKHHGALMQRYRDLQFCKVPGVTFGWAQKATLYTSRLKKESITSCFGTWTLWKGKPNSHNDRNVKLISCTYLQYQDKFRSLIKETAESHQEMVPTWYQDFFSMENGVKAVIQTTLKSMKVGGEGASLKLVKLGKDPIDDKAVGVLGPIDPKDVVYLDGPEHELKHAHYYMGFKSNESLWQPDYVARFEEALSQLEAHVEIQKQKAEAKAEQPAPAQAGAPVQDGTPAPAQKAEVHPSIQQPKPQPEPTAETPKPSDGAKAEPF